MQKEFIMVDAGMNGRISDGGVLYYSTFGALLQRADLNTPEPASLPNTTERFPYVFVGDEAFALRNNLMRPFSENSLTPDRFEFNKSLSRARVVVETTFVKASTITMACCYLPNFLAKESQQSYFFTSTARITEYDLVDLQSTFNRNCGTDAKTIRERLCNYYNNEGKL